MSLFFGEKLPDVEYVDRPGAYAVVRKGDLYAFIRGQAGLHLLGGGSEKDESPHNTLLREIAEEVGWQAKILATIGYATQFVRGYSGTYYAIRATYLSAELVEPREGPCEDALIWLPIDSALPELARESDAWAIRVQAGKP